MIPIRYDIDAPPECIREEVDGVWVMYDKVAHCVNLYQELLDFVETVVAGNTDIGALEDVALTLLAKSKT